MENCIISDANQDIDNFYIHKKNYLLSQYPKPKNEIINNFFQVEIIKKDIEKIISYYGKPYYIKIDLEEYDDIVLNKIFNSSIKPEYISVEATNFKVVELFSKNINYNYFKLHEGQFIDLLYKKMKLVINGKKIKFSFPENSAGPFGNDIPGDWINKDNFLKLMDIKKTGWRDIHASLSDKPKKIYDLNYYLIKDNKMRNKAKLIKRFRRILSKINFLKQ